VSKIAGGDTDAQRELRRTEERFLPSLWAERHRVIARGLWSFVGREYLRAPHDDFSRHVVVKKAAQLGWTEMAQNRIAHSADMGISCMMVLPTDDDVKRHSKARFKELCESSPYIGDMFRETDSVDVKRALHAAVYFEGAVSESAAHSVPIGGLVIDELDLCTPAVVEKFDLRLSGHANPWRMDISTPHAPGGPVDTSYADSDQKRWIVGCPKCEWTGPLSEEGPFDSWTLVTWENFPTIPERDRMEAVAKTARVKCPGCGSTWTEKQRKASVSAGKWVATYPDRMTSGYAINQLCSSTVDVSEFVLHYFKAHHDPNPDKMREFINQRVGEPFVGEGEQITETMVRALVTAPRNPIEANGTTSIGADIGKKIHAVVGHRLNGKLVVQSSHELDGWDDLDDLIEATGAASVVVDRMPEARNSEEFCARHPGVAYRAYHPEGMRETYNWDSQTSVVQIAHAPAVDLLQNRIRHATVEFWDRGRTALLVAHMLNVNVVLEENSRGFKERRVVKNGKPDHLAFACVYLEAAASRFVDSSAVVTTSILPERSAFGDADDHGVFSGASSWDADSEAKQWRDF
jgi:hypothetical protein